MKINTKTILIVLPLLITSLIITASISYLSARNGITEIATEYLNYKLDELEKYAQSQWDLLIASGLSDDEQYIEIAKSAVESFAKSIIRKETELIFAIDEEINIDISTDEFNLLEAEKEELKELWQLRQDGWHQVTINSLVRVCQAAYFKPFEWYIFVTEKQESFYQSVNKILLQTGIILVVAILISIFLLVFFTNIITKPIKNLSLAMEEIISTTDLSKRVVVQYADEIGRLGHTFNIMTDQLDKAYDQIKQYALKAVIAKSRETYIRNIFQKYVPKNIIEQFYANPESTLTGEVRELAILFADVRGFTKMLEELSASEITSSLSNYFELMVDIIMEHNGVVDKYIGDRIMAFYGAPVKHEDDVVNAVLSGLAMLRILDDFNKNQKIKDLPEFRIGIGLSYGKTIIGNIGSDKKMDYTVVGKTINISSRLERLTKVYKQPIIISENIFKNVNNSIPCRMLDHISVKNINETLRIYSPNNNLSEKEKLAWKYHKEGMVLYYKREFLQARDFFVKVKDIIIDDVCSDIFIERCDSYISLPPPENWDGIEVV
jgi:class 3 adenylate cyclase/HAMP domain-containing protein